MIDRLAGSAIFCIAVLTVIYEWSGREEFAVAAAAGMVLYLMLATPAAARSRWVFVAVGLALVLVAIASRPDWSPLIFRALKTASLIGAFFVALTWLRNAAASSPAITACGQYLADQPPGKRYLALNLGGHLFSLILNYGAISLLGNMAAESARSEANTEIRTVRTRRMLLAIQRGFVSMLCWSPLSFAIVITTSIVPGASWEAAAGPCLVSAIILAALGWSIDTIYKPKLSAPPQPRRPSTRNWTSMAPLFILLTILVVGIGILSFFTGLRAVAIVMALVPLLSLGWIVLQEKGSFAARLRRTMMRAQQYIVCDLPGYRSELVLLTIAGFIGTLGAGLLTPVVAANGISLHALPAWMVLVAIVWLIPIAGQFGMNPLLFVSLFAPLLPEPAAIGIPASTMIVALTAGWALSGASSPFTAATLLVGSLGQVSALHVGWRWNGAFTGLGAIALSAWVVAIAYL